MRYVSKKKPDERILFLLFLSLLLFLFPTHLKFQQVESLTTLVLLFPPY
jgi:hypothetical protein